MFFSFLIVLENISNDGSSSSAAAVTSPAVTPLWLLVLHAPARLRLRLVQVFGVPSFRAVCEMVGFLENNHGAQRQEIARRFRCMGKKPSRQKKGKKHSNGKPPVWGEVNMQCQGSLEI